MSIGTTIEHVIEINASPSTVFEMWTTSDGLRSWWGVAADVDPAPGGAIEVDIDGDNVMVGRFVEVEPPTRLVFTFGWQGGDPPPGSTSVEVRIESTGGGSQLTLRHTGLPIEHVESHARGWTHFLGERLIGVGP